MKLDLHCHSHYSDGKHPASFLIERALENGVTHLAITDHDCTNVHEKLDGSQQLSIIKGVETSCTWQNRELHIVCLRIDTRDSQLDNMLARPPVSFHPLRALQTTSFLVCRLLLVLHTIC